MVKRLVVPIVDAAAAVFRARGEILEVVAAGLFVAAAVQVSTALAMVVGGVCLLAKSLTIGRGQ